MILYHSSKDKPEDVLQPLIHLGSQIAAARRVETVFNGALIHAVTAANQFNVYDQKGTLLRRETTEDYMKSFSRFAEQRGLYTFTIDFKNPLRLTDCWDDDPIGSGAMAIFKDNDKLTDAERISLQKLFYPFTSVIYPDDVYERLDQEDIHEMQHTITGDPLFKSELRKREERASILNPFNPPAEIVWAAMTMRLRNWALERGYDSFVYENTGESEGDCYVPLEMPPAKALSGVLKFSGDEYVTQTLSTLQSAFAEAYINAEKGIARLTVDLNSENFWRESPANTL